MNYIIVNEDLCKYFKNVYNINPEKEIKKDNNTYNYMYPDTPYIRKLISNYHKEYNK